MPTTRPNAVHPIQRRSWLRVSRKWYNAYGHTNFIHSVMKFCYHSRDDGKKKVGEVGQEIQLVPTQRQTDSTKGFEEPGTLQNSACTMQSDTAPTLRWLHCPVLSNNYMFVWQWHCGMYRTILYVLLFLQTVPSRGPGLGHCRFTSTFKNPLDDIKASWPDLVPKCTCNAPQACPLVLYLHCCMTKEFRCGSLDTADYVLCYQWMPAARAAMCAQHYACASCWDWFFAAAP